MVLRSKLKKFIAGIACTAVAASSVPLTAAPSAVNAAGDNNYAEALALSLYMFDSNACGSGVTDGPLTWRGDCHTYDAQASLDGLSGSARQYADPDGNGSIDLSGGWHDAGDHIKFNITIGFGLSALGLSEFLNEGVYAKVGARDHLEYEMRRGAEYLMKTTILDGSGNVAAVAGTVADGNVDHSFWTAPETQTYERKVFWLTSGSNNSAVCCEMAAGLGASAYILKQTDPDFSNECIKYAKALLSFGTRNVGNNCEGMSFYSTDAQYQDEEAMAQAWLWQLGAGDKPSRVPHNKDYGNNQYDGWLFSWDKVWQGYSAFMYRATKDSVFKEELIVELNDRDGGLEVGRYNMAGSGWGNARYNCALQMDAFTIADGDPNSNYAKAAKWQMDYILGNNNLGYSFLIGYGDKWPTHIHHRAANPGGEGVTSAQNPSAKYTNYGMLVGGIDRDGYQDHADKYQYTEGALDYNGCFALACAYAANLYGGDPDAVKAIEKNAAEINDSFVFGNGGGTVVSQYAAPTFTLKDEETGELISGATFRITHTVAPADIPLDVSKEYLTWMTDYYNPYSPEDFFTSSPDVDQIYTFEFTAIPEGYIETENSFPDGKTFKFTDAEPIEITFTLKKAPKATLLGDSNCDNEVNLADAVYIMQSLANPTKYPLSEEGKLNADVNGGGVTNMDALEIQKLTLGLIDKFTNE